jgi:hypothetical protein
MKFDKRFLAKMVPEMKQHYIDYQILVEQIRLVRRAAYTLGSAFADLNENTQKQTRYTIAVSSLEPEQRFWGLMEDNLLRVESWYNESMERNLARFHELTHRTMQLGLVHQYIPIERALTTQLDRELERLGLSGLVPWKNERLPATYPPSSKCLVGMTRSSDLNEVLARSMAGFHESQRVQRTRSLTDDFDSEDDVPITQLLGSTDMMVVLKNKKAEEEMPDLEPPNWDEEDEDDPSMPSARPSASSSFSIAPNPSKMASGSTRPSRLPSSSSSFPTTNTTASASSSYLDDSAILPLTHAQLASQQSIPIPGSSRFSKHLAQTRDSGYGSDDGDSVYAREYDRQTAISTPQALDSPEASSSLLRRSKLIKAVHPTITTATTGPSALLGSRAPTPMNGTQVPYGTPNGPPRNSNFTGVNAGSPPFLSRGNMQRNSMDNFFDDFDNDREEDIVTPVRIEEYPNTGSPASSRDHHMQYLGAYPTMPRSTYMRGGADMVRHPPSSPTLNSSALSGLSSVNGMLPNGNQMLGNEVSSQEKNVIELQVATLKREWAEFYRDLHLLKQFALLNVEAITKILNKHDKNISGGAKHRFLQLEGSKFSFLRREHLKLVIRETEHVFAQAFTNGHRTAAMNALRVSNEAPEVGMATFRFGFFLGVSIVMGILIAFVCVITDSAYMIKLRPGLIVFRLLTLITFLMWSWGMTMVVCAKYRINYTHIFEFPERPLYQQVFEMAAFCTLVITISMLVFVTGGIQQFSKDFQVPGLAALASIPLAVLPLFVFLLVMIVLIGMQIKARWWGLLSLMRTISAPFFPVTYQDFHTAEILLSSCVLLTDFQFSLCYFFLDSFRNSDSCQFNYQWVKPLIVILPSVWRTLQCLRRWADLQEPTHLLNAGKYALGAVVTILAFLARVFANLGNFWVALWGIAVIALVTISSYWDIRRDWTLGEQQVKYQGLRTTLLLPARWYYAAIGYTPLGRLLFALTLSPDIVSSWLNTDVFVLLLASVEIIRKTIWVILRLETEQVLNADIQHINDLGPEHFYHDPYGEDILDAEFV